MRQRRSGICAHGALLTEGCEDCWIVPFVNADMDKAKAARKSRDDDNRSSASVSTNKRKSPMLRKAR